LKLASPFNCVATPLLSHVAYVRNIFSYIANVIVRVEMMQVFQFAEALFFVTLRVASKPCWDAPTLTDSAFDLLQLRSFGERIKSSPKSDYSQTDPNMSVEP
jgi:hypothetical protein